jgi:hypothetical protein
MTIKRSNAVKQLYFSVLNQRRHKMEENKTEESIDDRVAKGMALEDTEGKITKMLPPVITLKFRSELLLDKGKQVFRKKQDGFKEDGKIPNMVDDEDNPVFELNDIEVAIDLIKVMNFKKFRGDDERHHCMILEKLRERWRARDWDCEIQFSEAEARFLKGYLNNVYNKAVEKAEFGAYHSRTKFSLLDQLKERV